MSDTFEHDRNCGVWTKTVYVFETYNEWRMNPDGYTLPFDASRCSCHMAEIERLRGVQRPGIVKKLALEIENADERLAFAADVAREQQYRIQQLQAELSTLKAHIAQTGRIVGNWELSPSSTESPLNEPDQPHGGKG